MKGLPASALAPALALTLALALALGLPPGSAAAASNTGFTPARPLTPLAPDYPKSAIANDIDGWVDVEFTVTAQGSVKDVSIVDSDPPGVFDRSALRAVSHWSFKPARRNGQPVVSRVREHIVFTP